MLAVAGLVILAAIGGSGAWLLWSGTEAEPLPDLVFTFDAGTSGPLDAGESYDLTVSGGDANTLYRLVLDGVPVGQPSLSLGSFDAAAGRHRIAVEVTRRETEQTDAIEIYVIGELPAAGYRANPASVAAGEETWTAAIDRFDGLVADGHSGLELLPSDRFPLLLSGWWNLYVPGFGEDMDAAEAYRAQDSLGSTDCFAHWFDPLAFADES